MSPQAHVAVLNYRRTPRYVDEEFQAGTESQQRFASPNNGCHCWGAPCQFPEQRVDYVMNDRFR